MSVQAHEDTTGGYVQRAGGRHSGLSYPGAEGSAPASCCMAPWHLGNDTARGTTVEAQLRIPLPPQAFSQGDPKGLSQAFPALSIRIKCSWRGGGSLASHNTPASVTPPSANSSASLLPDLLSQMWILSFWFPGPTGYMPGARRAGEASALKG